MKQQKHEQEKQQQQPIIKKRRGRRRMKQYRNAIYMILFFLLITCPSSFIQSQETKTINNQEERDNNNKEKEEESTKTKTTTTSSAATGEEEIFSMDSNPRRMPMMDGLFLLSKPRGCIEGFGCAVRNVAVGITTALASLIGMPFMGLKSKGLIGLVIGTLLGSISGVLLTISGFLTGIYQLALGIQNTPSSIRAGRQGMAWDIDSRQWMHYNLDLESRRLLLEAQAKIDRDSEFARRNDRIVVDDSYYQLLGVPINATSSDIKRAYYKQARIAHPDKNVGTRSGSGGGGEDLSKEESEIQFRRLSTAYQTLSDDTLRAKYDKHGPAAVEDPSSPSNGPILDPYVFFAVMFGSELVHSYVGELAMATLADAVVKLGRDAEDFNIADAMSESDLAYRKRTVDIALNLRRRIEPYTNGTQTLEEYTKGCWNEADDISKSAFGSMFLRTIGRALVWEAEQYLGSHHQSFFGWRKRGKLYYGIKKKILDIQMRMDLYGAMMKAGKAGWLAYTEAVQSHYDAMRDATSEEESQEAIRQFRAKLELSLPSVFQLAWSYNVRDITSVLRAACFKVFADTSSSAGDSDSEGTSSSKTTKTTTKTMATKMERIRRAEAIRVLGEAFLFIGEASDANGEKILADADDIRTRAEIAFMATMAKAQGQETEHNDWEEKMNEEVKKKKKKTAA